MEYNMQHLCTIGGSVPFKRFIGLGLLLAVLAACSPSATLQPTTARAPTATPIPPTSTPYPAGKVETGFTAEGWPYRGNPKAAVTLWEFSEFQ
jgi:hypothetical protein